jgi:16S rRNA A1518/A1519 N6-dimethyltransferase RsmA/KsgA/DIM1 with predicted DNA glycosylase/AP lyase activity
MTPGDDEIAAQADPALGQHFLLSAEKLSKLVAAAGIRPEDDVVELGAGVGTVARELPRARSLTVVEFDSRLLRFLQRNVPYAQVIHGDALEIIGMISFDVLIGNLPHRVTESLLEVLPRLSFRTAVLSVGESADLDQLRPGMIWSEVATVADDDFLPPQSSVSRLVKIVPARA